MGPLIALEQLSYAVARRGDPLPILEDISLVIERGDTLGVVGRSGVGKSTLINLIAGYLTPTGGRIREDGQPVVGPARSRFVVFQDGSLWPWLTIRRNLRLALPDSETRDPTIARMLDRLGIAEAVELLPSQLSGGMRKRAELARALLARPALLMLDEALGSVDPVTKQLCIDLIQEFQRDSDAALMVVSHDIAEIVSLTERVLVLAGRPARLDQTVEIGTPVAPHDKEAARERLLSALGYRP